MINKINKALMYGFGTASMGFYVSCLEAIYQPDYQKAVALGVASIISLMFSELAEKRF